MTRLARLALYVKNLPSCTEVRTRKNALEAFRAPWVLASTTRDRVVWSCVVPTCVGTSTHTP